MTIEQYIKGKAEGYSHLMVWVNKDPECDEIEFHEYISEKSYTSGCKDTLELMMGFVKWKDLNFEETDFGVYEPIYKPKNVIYRKPFSIDQLLTKYIESINKQNHQPCNKKKQ